MILGEGVVPSEGGREGGQVIMSHLGGQFTWDLGCKLEMRSVGGVLSFPGTGAHTTVALPTASHVCSG